MELFDFRYDRKSRQILQIISICAYLLLGLSFLSYKDYLNTENIGLYFIIQFLISIIILKVFDRKLLSISFLFILFNLIIHCGHYILIFLGYDNVLGYDQRYYTTAESFYNASTFVFFINYLMLIGVLLCKRKNYIVDDDYKKTNDRILFSVGIIFLIISIVPRLYIDVSRFMLFLEGGYFNTYELTVNGYIIIIAKMFDVGFFIILVSKANNAKAVKKIMIIYILYILFNLINGNRGEGVISLIIIIFIYLKISKVSGKVRYISILIFMYFILALLFTIMDLRTSEFNLSIFINTYYQKLFNESPILSLFAEFGVSIRSVATSIDTFPQSHGFSYGLNYIKGLLTIFPNVNGIISNIINETTFIYYFNNHRTLGGSFIGELYYAFGYYSVVIAILIGFILAKLDDKIQTALINRNWYKFIILIIPLKSLFWWIRDYFYSLVREIILITIIFIVLYKFLERYNKRKI